MADAGAEGGGSRRWALLLGGVLGFVLHPVVLFLLDEPGSMEVCATLAAAIGIFGLLRFLQKQRRVQHEHPADVPFSLRERVMYQLDYWFSTSKASKPVALLVATVCLIVVGAFFLFLVEPQDFGSAIWAAWTWVADPGTHVEVPGGMSRAVAFGLTVGGMLVFALLIGIVADEISEKVDDLRKGKSRVLELNHTLILNWSDKIMPLIEEICEANDSEGGGTIVIMCDQYEKEEMERLLDEADLDLKGTKLVCRHGSATVPANLQQVSCGTAKAIVLLSQVNMSPDESDSFQLRAVLTLLQLIDPAHGPHIVAELCDIDNAHLVDLVSQDRVETVVAHDVIGRLMIQSARTPAMSLIMAELSSFSGVEIYFKEWPELVGMPFSRICFAFDDAVVIGIKKSRPGQGFQGNQVLLNPPKDLIIEAGDQVIVVAEDDDSYTVKEVGVVPGVGRLPPWTEPLKKAERLLFLNWRRDMDDMIEELDRQVGPDSELWLMSGKPETEQLEALREGGLDIEKLQNLHLVFRSGNTANRKHLEELRLERFDSVMILAEENTEDGSMQASDSKSLASLLLVRDIQNERLKDSAMVASTKILVSEVLETHTRELVISLNKSDYVMSNQVVAAILAQIAESRDMNAVFTELLTDEGNELYLRSAHKYCREGEELCFFDFVARALAYGECAMGYKLAGEARTIINPPNKDSRRLWHARDCILVVASD